MKNPNTHKTGVSGSSLEWPTTVRRSFIKVRFHLVIV